MFTVHTLAKRFKGMGIDIPDPLPETVRTAKEVGLTLPCKHCPFDYVCNMCDEFMTVKRINNPAMLNEYLVSVYGPVRDLASAKFEELQRR